MSNPLSGARLYHPHLGPKTQIMTELFRVPTEGAEIHKWLWVDVRLDSAFHDVRCYMWEDIHV